MKNRKSRESFCRSIFAIYIKDWSTFWYVNRCYVYFFCGKFLNMCMPRTTTYPLWQPGPPGLTFYGSGLACLSSWMGMVNADWLCSMRSEVFLQIKFITFKGCPTKLHFFSLLHIISFLFCHFRSWDYPEHFGIYSQLNRKSKTWLFISPKVFFLNRTGENPNLTAFTSKIQIFLKPEWNKSRPHENEFWQFSNAKMRFLKN